MRKLNNLSQRFLKALTLAENLEEKVRMELNTICKEHGNQRKLARQLGVSDAYVSDMKRGARNITDIVARKIVEINKRTEVNGDD